MTVYIYETQSPPTESTRFLARFYVPTGPKRALEWSIAYLVGSDPDELRARAEKWWGDQIAKERTKAENIARRGAIRKAATATAVVQTPVELEDII